MALLFACNALLALPPPKPEHSDADLPAPAYRPAVAKASHTAITQKIGCVKNFSAQIRHRFVTGGMARLEG